MLIIDKKFIAELLVKYVPYNSLEELESFIEIPPDEYSYTYAFPCFRLAKFEKKPPQEIAQELRKKIEIPDSIQAIDVEGFYLNFLVKSRVILENIYHYKENYGRIREKTENISKSRVVIEYPSPNTNKPLHFGHIRNITLS